MAKLLDQIRAVVDDERERFGVPGCSVVIVKNGEVLLSEGFGLRDIDADFPVTSKTLFPIGSSTKTFTSAVLASLADDGTLDLDAPIRTYLPGFRLQDPIATELLSVRDCLSHRSGLPRHDVLWYAGDGILTRDDAISSLEHLPPAKPFRQTWQYNNLLFLTAGQLAGKLSGGTYEDAVRSRILDPLGMTRTSFRVADVQGDDDHALPYVKRHGDEQVKSVPFASLNLVGPAGCINSCADDLGAWLLALLGQGVSGADPVLSNSVLAELRTPTMPLGPTPEDGPIRKVGYGLGLFIEEYRGRRLTHHGGNIDGFSAQVLTSLSDGIGTAVLTNLGGTALRDAVPYLILDLLDGIAPGGHGVRLRSEELALRESAAKAQEHASADKKPLAAVRPLHDYIGTYKHLGYGEVVVSQLETGLIAQYLGLPPARLEHKHLEVFDFVVPISGEEERLAAQFTHDLNGDVDALRLGIEPALAPLRFELQPDTSHLTDELLDSLIGSYTMGPVTVVVSRRGKTDLVVNLTGQPSGQLRPVSGRTFSLQGSKVEFTEDGRILTPHGEFVRA